MTTVAIPTETRPGERRVALMPDVVSKLTALGLDVRVEAGAGVAANATDDAFREVGATVVNGSVLDGADVVFSVNSLTVDQLRQP